MRIENFAQFSGVGEHMDEERVMIRTERIRLVNTART